MRDTPFLFFFFFNDTATTEIYTLSLHDALPILVTVGRLPPPAAVLHGTLCLTRPPAVVHLSRYAMRGRRDRKSTRLNSSHSQISYAVFCLKKKKKLNTQPHIVLCHSYRLFS